MRPRKRGKQPDLVQPTRNLVSIWDTFGVLFQKIRGGLDPERRVRFDELMHAVPDSQFIHCFTCGQAVMGEAMVMELLVQVLEQAALPETRRSH